VRGLLLDVVHLPLALLVLATAFYAIEMLVDVSHEV
jgi:hypothetical protein